MVASWKQLKYFGSVTEIWQLMKHSSSGTAISKRCLESSSYSADGDKSGPVTMVVSQSRISYRSIISPQWVLEQVSSVDRWRLVSLQLLFIAVSKSGILLKFMVHEDVSLLTNCLFLNEIVTLQVKITFCHQIIHSFLYETMFPNQQMYLLIFYCKVFPHYF